MSTAELSDVQQSMALERLEPQVNRVVRMNSPEQNKLRMIGHLVAGVILDLKAAVYGESKPKVQPSVLPQHDDVTITHMANWQRMLREDTTLTDAERALHLDRLEHFELFNQKDGRVVTI